MTPFVVAFICAIVYYIYVKVNSVYKYWDRRGIKGPEPQYVVGTFGPVIRKTDSVTSLTKKIYDQFPEEKVIGIYQGWEPALLIKDPSLVKRILIKDFQTFASRGIRSTDNNPLSKNLFSIDDVHEWKILRQKLSPVFTAGKIKQLMPLLNKCVEEYMNFLEHLLKKPDPVEIRSLKMKYTLKSITTIAFGLDIDTFNDENCKFIEMAKKIFAPQNSKRMIRNLLPGFLRNLITFNTNEVVNFFLDLVSQITKEREGKPKVRKDFMDFMIDLKEQRKVRRSNGEDFAEIEITDAVVAAQAMVYYAAGFESSSGTMSFLLYELAMNPEIQERCYNEIEVVFEKHKGDLTYEALQELNYLSMTFDETLRKYPVAGLLMRESISDYEISELNLTLKKGTKVLISAMAMHRDSRYFPDPDKFIPERFAPENIHKIQDCTYLPFGEGPRNCIGLRFAKVQSLLGLAHFIRKIRVVPGDRTMNVIEFDPSKMMLTAKDGIWLSLHPRC